MVLLENAGWSAPGGVIVRLARGTSTERSEVDALSLQPETLKQRVMRRMAAVRWLAEMSRYFMDTWSLSQHQRGCVGKHCA